MSFSVNTQGKADELANALERKFREVYPEPNAGVAELFGAGLSAVEKFGDETPDEGNFNARVSGHSQQEFATSVRDSLSVLINPID